jgi:hypothetical protein
METHLPPQPPPDVPAPPPGPEAIRSRRKMSAIVLGICLSIALLVVVAFPVVLKKRGAADRTSALNHLKSLHFALIEFDTDYGRFPDASTIASVKSATETTIPLGTTTSNDYFRQLIAAGNRGETIFWAKNSTTPRKPDNNITGTHALEKGECSYAYVAGLSTTDDPCTPIAMAPMISGAWKFDPKPYDNRAVVLRVDGSTRPETLMPSGDLIHFGKNLFDPSQPHWHGKAPDLKWPE